MCASFNLNNVKMPYYRLERNLLYQRTLPRNEVKIFEFALSANFFCVLGSLILTYFVWQTSMKAFLRYFEAANTHNTSSPAELTIALSLREARRQIQNTIKYDTSLIVETGDRYAPVLLSLIFYYWLLYPRPLLLFLKSIILGDKTCQFTIFFNQFFIKLSVGLLDKRWNCQRERNIISRCNMGVSVGPQVQH